MAHPLPANVHVSTHPCLRAKLSRFRSRSTSARENKILVNEIATIISCEALATGLSIAKGGTDESQLGYPYEIETIEPTRISVVPILRSGLGMVEAITSVLPDPTPIHHLGLFREPTTLQPVEYYNNLPYHDVSHAQPKGEHLAILIDPIIATGGTAIAAIQTLREWGVTRVIMLSILGSTQGIRTAAEEWPEGVEIWVGSVDNTLDAKGMIVPGVGDVGDRLFMTKGK